MPWLRAFAVIYTRFLSPDVSLVDGDDAGSSQVRLCIRGNRVL
jgi:hypothetical protein